MDLDPATLGDADVFRGFDDGTHGFRSATNLFGEFLNADGLLGCQGADLFNRGLGLLDVFNLCDGRTDATLEMAKDFLGYAVELFDACLIVIIDKTLHGLREHPARVEWTACLLVPDVPLACQHLARLVRHGVRIQNEESEGHGSGIDD